MNFPQQTPAKFIAEIERTGTRHATPAGQGEIVWRVFGRGEPLALLHGGTGSWLHWVRNVEALAADFMLLVPEFRAPANPQSGAADHRRADRGGPSSPGSTSLSAQIHALRSRASPWAD